MLASALMQVPSSLPSCAALHRTVPGGFQVWDPQVVGTGLLNGTAMNSWPRQGLDNVSCLITAADVMVANFSNMSEIDYGTVNVPVRGHLCGDLCRTCHSNCTVGGAVDLSDLEGMRITYSATSDAILQLRTGLLPHGGDHNAHALPATGGAFVSTVLRWTGFTGGSEDIGRAVAQTYAFTLACLGTAGRDNLLRVSEFRGSKKGSTLVEGGGSA